MKSISVEIDAVKNDIVGLKQETINLMNDFWSLIKFEKIIDELRDDCEKSIYEKVILDTFPHNRSITSNLLKDLKLGGIERIKMDLVFYYDINDGNHYYVSKQIEYLDYISNPIYCADDFSRKGIKRDKTNWNHVITKKNRYMKFKKKYHRQNFFKIDLLL